MLEVTARIALALACAFAGTILPTLPLWGNTKIVNPFWDIIYGLGLFIGGFLPGGLRSTPSLFFGVILWLPAVTILLYWVFGMLFQMKSGTQRTFIMVALVFTFLFNIDRSVIQREPYYRLPFFTNFLGVIY